MFFLALLLTVAVEGAAMYFLYRRKDYVYYSFLGNLLTNPALNLALLLLVRLFGTDCYYPALLILEIAVWITETFLYKLLCNLKTSRAAMLSCFLNGLSFAAGLLLF